MTSYIEPEKEEEETTNNKDLIKNVNINKDTKYTGWKAKISGIYIRIVH